MSTLRIAAVSYLNTIPFVYGINKSGIIKDFSLELCPPATCAKKLFSNKADISLVPVGALVNKTAYHIISNYCIGANGDVGSVFIFSECPIKDIKEIYLDSHSMTSILLAKIIVKNFWKINVKWNDVKIDNIEKTSYETVVAIGDKTFNMEKTYKYQYDLSGEWQKFTNLPFVFACWVSLIKIPTELELNINKAFEFGIKHKIDALKEYYPQGINNIDSVDYLENKISFNFDTHKKTAFKRFLDDAKEFI